jgi:hypothetical protein
VALQGHGSLKWNLWHGNVYRAFQQVEDLEDDLEAIEENPANKRKLSKAVQEFGSYIDANQDFIPNYGDRHRHDETISTAFVESTVNYVVSKRFVSAPAATDADASLERRSA